MSSAVLVGGSSRLALMRLLGCNSNSVVSMRLPRRPLAPCRSSARSKGFGAPKVDSNDSDESRKVKRKRVNIRREESPIPNQGDNNNTGNSGAFAGVKQLEDNLLQEKDDEDFAARLAVVRQAGQERRREVQAGTQRPGSAAAAGAAFDTASSVDMYANPPSLSSTLLSQLNSDVSDPKLKNAQFGPNQVAVAVSAVVFGLVFVLVSGADFAPSKRYKGVQPAQQPPDELQAALIKGRIAQLENAREADPSDVDALEGLAVSYAQLFEFDKAAGLLDKLVAAQPKNAEAWRLLGETTLLSQQPARSVAAYEKAAALNSGDLQVLTGLADAYIANAQQAKAIAFLKDLKERTAAAGATATAAAATAQPAAALPLPIPAEATGEAVASSGAAADAATPSTSGNDATAGSSGSGSGSPAASKSGSSSSASPPPAVDAASLDLLVGKVYSRWRGHEADAIATYDALIAQQPEDFRGYLAKGLLLKEQGRKSDAERMFIQARFYAPESRQRFIERVTAANPVLDLPSND